MTIYRVVEIKTSKSDAAEKVLIVWEDRVQHADLDADEINFPYFKKDTVGDLLLEATEHVTVDSMNNDYAAPESFHQLENNNNSMFTFSHSININNVTRKGNTTVPSSSILPFLKQSLSSVSEESAMLLAMGGLLPMLMISLPMLMMPVLIPVVLLVARLLLDSWPVLWCSYLSLYLVL